MIKQHRLFGVKVVTGVEAQIAASATHPRDWNPLIFDRAPGTVRMKVPDEVLRTINAY